MCSGQQNTQFVGRCPKAKKKVADTYLSGAIFGPNLRKFRKIYILRFSISVPNNVKINIIFGLKFQIMKIENLIYHTVWDLITLNLMLEFKIAFKFLRQNSQNILVFFFWFWTNLQKLPKQTKKRENKYKVRVRLTRSVWFAYKSCSEWSEAIKF